MPPSDARETGASALFRVWPAARERLKRRRVRVTIQQPRHSVSDDTRRVLTHAPSENTHASARCPQERRRVLACPRGIARWHRRCPFRVTTWKRPFKNALHDILELQFGAPPAAAAPK